MEYSLLSEEELTSHKVGVAITISSVMAVLCAIVAAVVIYKMFFSKEGTATIPGGWKFTWE